jgi:sugar/nucleoside kinase (ribokinase family)
VALNVQTNSSNYGFNLVRPEDRADYLVLDELEARLSTGNRSRPLQDSLLALTRNAPKVIITLGRDGAMGWSEETGICTAPALTTRVVDTMGAGDCFFAVTAPLAKAGTIHQLMAIGNAAAALKCQVIGHREPITKEALIGYLEANPKS